MNSPDCFNGPLAAEMADFILHKRMQGYIYKGQVNRLGLFDRFITEQECPDGAIQGGVYTRYRDSIAHLTPGTQENYLSIVRVFSQHLHAWRPESAVMPPNMAPRHARPTRFRRIAPEEVAALMEAAGELNMRCPVGPHAVRFLIGLLYSTGLRISEAIKLDLGDVDPHCGTLHVRRGKFAKDRLVALSESASNAFDDWLRLRSRYAPTALSAPLLPGGRNGRLTYTQSRVAFRTLCLRCGLHGEPQPRLHDLRHNFACNCIARWREAGEDVQTLLPVLANAMGHVGMLSTQWYVHLDAAELQPASNRLKQYFTQNNS
ncbi:MAG: tyrosine-type recombinase/integrase [Verrucomicrobiota bacterium]